MSRNRREIWKKSEVEARRIVFAHNYLSGIPPEKKYFLLKCPRLFYSDLIWPWSKKHYQRKEKRKWTEKLGLLLKPHLAFPQYLSPKSCQMVSDTYCSNSLEMPPAVCSNQLTHFSQWWIYWTHFYGQIYTGFILSSFLLHLYSCLITLDDLDAG